MHSITSGFLGCVNYVTRHSHLQAVRAAVRSFIRRQNCLLGCLISSEVWCFHKVWRAWPLNGHSVEQYITAEWQKGDSSTNVHYREITTIDLHSHDVAVLHQNMTESQPYIYCGQHYYYYYYVFILSTISPYTTGLKALCNQCYCTGTAPTHK